MPAIYQGDKKIVDRYVGETLITRAYQGNKLIFDAYSELSGTLPLTVRSRASQIFKNYIIYGTESGAGVETENLAFDWLQNCSIGASGIISANNVYGLAVARVESGQTYAMRVDYDSSISIAIVYAYYTEMPQIGSVSYNESRNSVTAPTQVFTAPITGYVAVWSVYGRDTIVHSATAPSSYIPHGYKLPITVTSNGTTTDYPVYIGDSKLGAEEYVDYESGKVYKRTENLFNYEKTDGIIDNCYINQNGDYVTTTRNYYLSYPIYISPQEDYVWRWGWTNLHTAPTVAFYDSNDALIGVAQHNSNISGFVFTTPSNVSYVRASVYKAMNDAKTAMLVKGDTIPSVFIPYLQPTDPPVPLPDITLSQGEVTIDTEEEFKCHSTIKGRINPVHYAYRINADTAEITYLADNKNFTPAAMGDTDFDYGSWENAFFMPRPCMLKSDGTVDYYLDPNDYSKKLDGTASDIADPTYDGNVMLEFPKIWYKFEPTGDDGEGGTFHCSNVKLDDSYECWCNYDANNNEIDHFYVAAYNAVILDNKMRSLSGYALTQENGADTTTGATEIAAARANNQNGMDEWYTYLISDHQLLTYLATLMCKHVNHQTKFGRGLDSGSTAAKRAYVTGTLNDKGLFWGDTSTGTQGVKIFGIENFYACVWKRAAGLIGTSTGYSYKLTHGTKDGSTATSFNTNGSGYKTLARTKPAKGYVTTMRYEANGFWIPATTGANRYAVYHWTGNGYVLVGGVSGVGSGCGSWLVGLSSGVGYSYWDVSSALSCKPKA